MNLRDYHLIVCFDGGEEWGVERRGWGVFD